MDLDPEPNASDLAYEMLQGPLVRWTTRDAATPQPPTAVLLHGVLGSRRNLAGFARSVVDAFPSWQILLVDLRCHGDSARLANAPPPPHSLPAAAADVLRLLRLLKLFPNMLIGHSFGGKVVMEMVRQFAPRGAHQALPRPVQVWVLDALPGEVQAGGAGSNGEPDPFQSGSGSGSGGGSDHPAALLAALRAMPLPIAGRNHVIDTLRHAGFSSPVARWAVTNLRPLTPAPGQPALDPATGRAAARYTWAVDLPGISDLYASYEATSLWGLLESPPQGLALDFVKAEGSSWRWAGGDEARIAAAGHRVHLLRGSGHWVHSDNPAGLLQLLAPSFDVRRHLPLRRQTDRQRTGVPGGG